MVVAILREFFSIGTLYIDIMKCRFDWRCTSTTSIQFDTEKQKLSCAADVILAFEILTPHRRYAASSSQWSQWSALLLRCDYVR